MTFMWTEFQILLIGRIRSLLPNNINLYNASIFAPPPSYLIFPTSFLLLTGTISEINSLHLNPCALLSGSLRLSQQGDLKVLFRCFVFPSSSQGHSTVAAIDTASDFFQYFSSSILSFFFFLNITYCILICYLIYLLMFIVYSLSPL